MNNFELVASAARTTSGTSSVETIIREKAAFYLDCTAVSGTAPTLDVIIEGKAVGSNNWYTIGTFAQLNNTTGNERIVINPLIESEIRVSWTIGGATPSCTFSVHATAK